MKRSITARIIIAVALALTLSCLLSSCSIIEGFLDKYKKWDGSVVEVTEDSKECVESFARALVDGDLSEAKTNMHPNSNPPADEIEEYVESQLEALDIDFSEDVSFAFDGFEPEINLEHIKYDIKGHATVGGKTVTLKLGVMKDEYGFGIYNITIE